MVAGGGLTTGYYHFTDEDASDFLIPKPSSGKSGFVSECLAFLTFLLSSLLFTFFFFPLVSSFLLFLPLLSSHFSSFYFFSLFSPYYFFVFAARLSSPRLFYSVISSLLSASLLLSLISSPRQKIFYLGFHEERWTRTSEQTLRVNKTPFLLVVQAANVVTEATWTRVLPSQPSGASTRTRPRPASHHTTTSTSKPQTSPCRSEHTRDSTNTSIV